MEARAPCGAAVGNLMQGLFALLFGHWIGHCWLGLQLYDDHLVVFVAHILHCVFFAWAETYRTSLTLTLLRRAICKGDFVAAVG